MSMSIQHDHTLNPVTALQFCGGSSSRLLLAGEGSFLKVFETETSKLISQCEIFNGQTIHGIAVVDGAIKQENELQAVIWGGHSLTLLTKKSLDQLLNGDVSSIAAATTSVSDWILDVALAGHERDSCILVTAHNTVIQARLDENAEVILKELPSPSKSILYSAHLIWDTSKRIFVAAGTVFGEIIVWECEVSEGGVLGKSKVLFTFTGHDGSIFGVNISPVIIGPGDIRTRLLASCSDDRTIRIWDLSESLTTSTALSTAMLPRETGYGENEGLELGAMSQERCVATIMGHASRIWRVKFLVHRLSSDSPSIVNVLSFGEDSTALQWALELNAQVDHPNAKAANCAESKISSRYAGSLRQVNTFAFHSGKHIWSADLLSRTNQNEEYVLVTGGADGKISLYDIDPTGNITAPKTLSDEDSIAASVEWDLNDVYTLLPSNTHTTNLDTSNAEAEIQEDAAHLTPTEGKPVKKRKPKKPPKDTFNRYAFVLEDQFIASTTFGQVLLCQLGPILRWKELTLPEAGKEDLRSYSVVEGFPELGAVFLAGGNGSMYSYSKGSSLRKVGSVEGKVADMFKISGGGYNALLVTTLGSGVATLLTVEEITDGYFGFSNRVSVVLSEKFVVTSAGMSNSLLVLGSRHGSIATYNRENPDHPLSVWRNEDSIAGDAITIIIPLPTPSSENKTYFLTTGRDGRYSIFTMLTNNQILLIHRGTPPLGPNIEAAWFSTPGNELILYGFRGKNFIVWNETLQHEITNIECGGAHRSYAYSPLGHFIYTKASKLHIHSQTTSSSHKTIKQGGHGREIKACAVSPNGEFFATGAEDTAIRIWRYSDATESKLQRHFKCLSVTQKHTAGIQHVQWHTSSYLFTSAGNEEFFIWAITPIPSLGIGILCEASCPDQSADKDLRIMSFDVSEVPGSGLLISLAYSDSTVKIYKYTKSTGFVLRAKGRYTSSCLTQIKHLHVAEREVKLLTASTDGYLALWESNSSSVDLTMLSNTKIHQNAIKSLAISISNLPDIIVATGGDDNALAFTLFSSTSSNPKIFRMRSAHAAAITGLSFIPRPVGGMLRVVSSGNDQRVREWEVRVVGGEVRVEKMGDVFTAVADVGGVEVLRGEGEGEGRKVLVVGNGMEVWNVSRS